MNFGIRPLGGEKTGLPDTTRDGYLAHSRWSFQVRPSILKLASFARYAGKKVQEISVGFGGDHQLFAENGAILTVTEH